MLIYHRTDATQSILTEGFSDGEGNYLTTEIHQGVWFSDHPLDEGEGAFGDVILALDIPEEIFKQYEWVDEEKPYRESLIPAEIANTYGTPRVLSEEEIDKAVDEGWARRWAKCEGDAMKID